MGDKVCAHTHRHTHSTTHTTHTQSHAPADCLLPPPRGRSAQTTALPCFGKTSDVQRGIIPRAASEIFEIIKTKAAGTTYGVQVPARGGGGGRGEPPQQRRPPHRLRSAASSCWQPPAAAAGGQALACSCSVLWQCRQPRTAYSCTHRLQLHARRALCCAVPVPGGLPGEDRRPSGHLQEEPQRPGAPGGCVSMVTKLARL